MKKTLIPIVIMLIVGSLSGCRGKMPPNTVYSEEDMEGRQVGVVLNSAAKTYAAGRGTIHEYTSAEAMLVDLKNGAIDCAVMDESVAKPLLGKVPGLKILSKPLLEAEFCFAIAKENPDLTKAVNKALKSLEESGQLKEIVSGHLTGDGYRYVSPENADRSAGTLTLAVDNRFPPYAGDDGTGNITGIDIDVARAVCDILGVGMKVVVFDHDSLITTVEFGKADFALGGLADNENDRKLVDFSEPYVKCKQVIVTRK